MPVLARLHHHKFYLNAGPYAGYNVGSRLKTDGSNTSFETTTKVSFGNAAADLKRWDFGYILLVLESSNAMNSHLSFVIDASRFLAGHYPKETGRVKTFFISQLKQGLNFKIPSMLNNACLISRQDFIDDYL